MWEGVQYKSNLKANDNQMQCVLILDLGKKKKKSYIGHFCKWGKKWNMDCHIK